MKKKILILCLLLLCCTKEEPLYYYDYNPNQPIMLIMNVYPMEDVEINLNSLRKEINADYFNRYGIGIEVVLQERSELPQDLKDIAENSTDRQFYIPDFIDGPKYVQHLYVIPDFYMPSGIGGYALGAGRSVVKESNIYGTTVAHEIGHNLRLGHYPEWENVMFKLGSREQRGKPRDFLEEQIDTMINTLVEPIELNSIFIID